MEEEAKVKKKTEKKSVKFNVWKLKYSIFFTDIFLLWKSVIIKFPLCRCHTCFEANADIFDWSILFSLL